MELEEKVGCLKQVRHLKREVDQLSQRIAEMDDEYRTRRDRLGGTGCRTGGSAAWSSWARCTTSSTASTTA